MKWEYNVMTVDITRPSSWVFDAKKSLNEYGKEEWEVATGFVVGSSATIILKRPKQ